MEVVLTGGAPKTCSASDGHGRAYMCRLAYKRAKMKVEEEEVARTNQWWGVP